MLFAEEKIKQYQLQDKKILEVGSLNVNGSVRDLFNGGYAMYIGFDMCAGKGVDVVGNAHNMIFDSEIFDVVISTEMLEHDDKFWFSLSEMGRVLKPNGYLILTARGNGFIKHNHPSDYYRFMPEAFNVLFKLAGCEVLEIVEDTQYSGVFGIGQKTCS
jgi:SAM-dependent methyltransferase